VFRIRLEETTGNVYFDLRKTTCKMINRKLLKFSMISFSNMFVQELKKIK